MAMKKILSIALILILCLSMLVACGEDKKDDSKKDSKTTVASTPKGDDDNNDDANSETPDDNNGGDAENDATVTDAKDFLVQMYQTGNPAEAMALKADKDVLASAMGYDIAWSVSITKGQADAVKISESTKENHVLIDIADAITADVEFTAIATITDADGNSVTAEFLYAIAGPKEDPKADSTLSVKEAAELGASKAHNVYTSGKYYIVATVVEVTDTAYGNMKVKGDDGTTLTIYGSFGPNGEKFNTLDPQPKSGDKVKLYGIIGQYNETAQMKNANIKEVNSKKPGTAATTTRPTSSVKEPAANSNVSIADAISIALSKEHNVYTTNKYYVTGTVTEVYNAEYGNMRIKDDKGNILTIYGSFSADGKYSFSELKTQPKEGDKVKIYGAIGQYGEVPQIKNGWIIEINGKTPEISANVAEKPNATVVAKPQVGVAYKFGLDQTTKGSIYFFTGKMSGYYGATETDVATAVDVYLETAGDGYKVYFKDSTGAKKYIKLEQSGTHYNFTFGAEGSVFTWDAEKCSLYAPCGDAICYMGTYGTYVTFGCLTTEKLKDGDYVAHFYTIG